ncbi:MAG: aminotransferase class V-fold PLP-dependent enzyme [Elusimicrobiota bacterium]
MSEPPRVYLDHNATTPVRPEVREAMLPYLGGSFGNPSSVYSLGQAARRAVEEAREHVAELIGAMPGEIVFTSCGSESDVLAVCGAARAAHRRDAGERRHIITTEVEHEAVHGACRLLPARDFTATKLPVDDEGRVAPADVAAAIRPATAVVSVMLANNETGTIQPVGAIAEACRGRDILVHTDAVQAVGKIPVSVTALGVDLLSLSGHKINAPKGVGALYIRAGIKLEPLIAGFQERQRRGGTENVASIVGLGTAAALIRGELAAHGTELLELRRRLEAGLDRLPGARRTCRTGERLPNTCHYCFAEVDGHHLVVSLDLEGFCVSGGPACSGGMTELSHVLKAMRVPPEAGRGALRISLGWGSQREDIDRFLEVLPGTLDRLRRAE